jgi:hypothetical protein
MLGNSQNTDSNLVNLNNDNLSGLAEIRACADCGKPCLLTKVQGILKPGRAVIQYVVVGQIDNIDGRLFKKVDAVTINAQYRTAFLNRRFAFNQWAFKVDDRQIRRSEFLLKIVEYLPDISLLKKSQIAPLGANVTANDDIRHI